MKTKLVVHPDLKIGGEKVRCELIYSSYSGIVFHFINNSRDHINDMFCVTNTGLRLPNDRRKHFSNDITLDLKPRSKRLKITEIDGMQL